MEEKLGPKMAGEKMGTGQSLSRALFEALSQDMYIQGGQTESLASLYGRLAYSAAARNALASLWEADGVSRKRWEERASDTLFGFLELCEPLKEAVGNRRPVRDLSKGLARQMYGTYQRLGFFYAREGRLYPPAPTGAGEGALFLYRGMGPVRGFFMSGLAPYGVRRPKEGFRLQEGISSFLGLPRELNQEVIERFLAGPGWLSADQIPERSSYLWALPGEGWVSLKKGQVPKDAGEITLLNWNKGYGLFWYREGKALFKPLDDLALQEPGLQGLIMAVKNRQGIRSSIYVRQDGPIARLELRGTMADQEKEAFHLLTWPEEPLSLACEDKRILTAHLLPFFRELFGSRGYEIISM